VISSPMSGIVKNVKFTTLGGVLRGGDELLQVVPVDDQMIVEAKVLPRDIALIRPGLQATIKFDAYDYTVFGIVDGEVTYVSADTMRDESQRADSNAATYYRVHVRTTAPGPVTRTGRRIEVLPGMTAQVDIRTGQRSLLTYLLKTLHNFFGPLFAVSLLIVIVTFVRDELPQRGDLHWLLHAGGVFRKDGKEIPAPRFNAGEKVIFWLGALLLGSIAVGSGLVMDKLIPDLAYLRGDMQVAHMVHAVAAVLMIAMLIVHIYLGTVGMRGAYRAMRDGWVDDEWAREHHELWYRDIEAGKIPAQRSHAPEPPPRPVQP